MNLLSLVIFCFLVIITINTLFNFFNWNKTKIQKLNNEQLTILIPARNEARNIKKCIESIDISNDLTKVLSLEMQIEALAFISAVQSVKVNAWSANKVPI